MGRERSFPYLLSMLDLQRLKRIRLHERPLGQVLVGNFFLRPDYAFPKRTEIVLEGLEHLPDRPVFLAMNHTDRYNYWPFQYALYRRGLRFTATWVKGKYYESRLLAWFLDHTNNIPLPSRGYLITSEFRKRTGHLPGRDAYRYLRDLVDREIGPGDAEPPPRRDLMSFLRSFSDSIGQQHVEEDFLIYSDRLWKALLEEVVRLNRLALEERDLHLLVFPEGTRNPRLGKGRTGLAQMSQYLGGTILPVGCSGSDRVYPDNLPFARGGRIVYRIGSPLPPGGPELAPYRVTEKVTPFTREATRRYGARYEAITRVVMDRIDGLLDPPYRRPEGDEGSEEGGIDRFISG
ncbi:MAG: 1-acyl-sn-glycerol-3-phosphate acyltransferase [bacterium]